VGVLSRCRKQRFASRTQSCFRSSSPGATTPCRSPAATSPRGRPLCEGRRGLNGLDASPRGTQRRPGCSGPTKAADVPGLAGGRAGLLGTAASGARIGALHGASRTHDTTAGPSSQGWQIASHDQAGPQCGAEGDLSGRVISANELEREPPLIRAICDDR
jgi:hypothetical protein